MSEHFLRNGSFPPTRRYGHTMVTYDRFLYVFGGAADSTLPSDLHAFDLDEQTWSIIKVARSSQVPSCRLFHSATVIGDVMYVFGGTVDNNVRSAELFRFRFFIYPKCTLRQDFGLFLQNQHLCDIEFQFKDIPTGNECTMLAHINFVVARSKYFCNTLTEMTVKHGITLGQLNQPVHIELGEMNSQAFILLLHYMYTDQIDFNKVTIELLDKEKILLLIDVYTLALRFQIYQIDRLKNICIQYLNIELSINNALVVLENAVRLNLEFIKAICMKYIIKESNYLTLLMTKEFENLPKSLLIEIVRKKENQSSCEMKLTQPERPVAKPQTENNQSLEYDMKQFLRREEFADICLVLGQKEFKVHKAILAARGKYFEAIFRNFMPRDNRVSFQLGEVTPTEKALLSLLDYIYCGDTNIAPQHCLSLYLAPNFLGFTNNRLHIFCKHNLESNVNESNVLQVLIAANQLNIVEMKQYALNIITRNFSSIAKQNDINELDKNLLLEIIHNVAKVFKI